MSLFSLPYKNLRSQAIMGLAAALLLAGPQSARAEPIALKLSFFGSENTTTYRSGIKPFVDAVNRDGRGVLEIMVYPRGELGKGVAEQPRIVTDDVADIAWVVPGQTPYRFPDNELIGLPGLFRDVREGTLVYTRLIAANALRGYEDFVVIGAYTSAPTIISSRKPIDRLADLKGQKLRANNPVEADLLERLGAVPTVMSASRLAEAINRHSIDGAAFSPTAIFDFGVSPVVKNHYLLYGGVAPLALLMSRKKFDSLPDAAKAVIRKFSGAWTAEAWIAGFGSAETEVLARLQADGDRHVAAPSPSDLAVAQAAERAIIQAWAAKSVRNRELLTLAETELAKIRSTR